MTTADYFTISVRLTSFTSIAATVAGYDALYCAHFVSHVATVLLVHWDASMRSHAAAALRALAGAHRQAPGLILSHALPPLLANAASTDVAARHGALLGLAVVAEVIAARKLSRAVPMTDDKESCRAAAADTADEITASSLTHTSAASESRMKDIVLAPGASVPAVSRGVLEELFGLPRLLQSKGLIEGLHAGLVRNGVIALVTALCKINSGDAVCDDAVCSSTPSSGSTSSDVSDNYADAFVRRLLTQRLPHLMAFLAESARHPAITVQLSSAHALATLLKSPRLTALFDVDATVRGYALALVTNAAAPAAAPAAAAASAASSAGAASATVGQASASQGLALALGLLPACAFTTLTSTPRSSVSAPVAASDVDVKTCDLSLLCLSALARSVSPQCEADPGTRQCAAQALAQLYVTLTTKCSLDTKWAPKWDSLIPADKLLALANAAVASDTRADLSSGTQAAAPSETPATPVAAAPVAAPAASGYNRFIAAAMANASSGSSGVAAAAAASRARLAAASAVTAAARSGNPTAAAATATKTAAGAVAAVSTGKTAKYNVPLSIALRKPPSSPSEPAAGVDSVPAVTVAIINTLLSAFDDYATDSRGDVGSWVREAAVLGLKHVLAVTLRGADAAGTATVGASAPPVSTSAPSASAGGNESDAAVSERAIAHGHSLPLLPVVFLTVARALLQQGSEKLDRVRGVALSSLHSLLLLAAPFPHHKHLLSTFTVMGALQEEVLRNATKDAVVPINLAPSGNSSSSSATASTQNQCTAASSSTAVSSSSSSSSSSGSVDASASASASTVDWSTPAMSFSLAARLLPLVLYRPALLSGLALSAGGLTESTLKSSLAALCEFAAATDEHHEAAVDRGNGVWEAVNMLGENVDAVAKQLAADLHWPYEVVERVNANDNASASANVSANTPLEATRLEFDSALFADVALTVGGVILGPDSQALQLAQYGPAFGLFASCAGADAAAAGAVGSTPVGAAVSLPLAVRAPLLFDPALSAAYPLTPAAGLVWGLLALAHRHRGDPRVVTPVFATIHLLHAHGVLTPSPGAVGNAAAAFKQAQQQQQQQEQEQEQESVVISCSDPCEEIYYYSYAVYRRVYAEIGNTNNVPKTMAGINVLLSLAALSANACPPVFNSSAGASASDANDQAAAAAAAAATTTRRTPRCLAALPGTAAYPFEGLSTPLDSPAAFPESAAPSPARHPFVDVLRVLLALLTHRYPKLRRMTATGLLTVLAPLSAADLGLGPLAIVNNANSGGLSAPLTLSGAERLRRAVALVGDTAWDADSAAVATAARAQLSLLLLGEELPADLAACFEQGRVAGGAAGKAAAAARAAAAAAAGRAAEPVGSYADLVSEMHS